MPNLEQTDVLVIGGGPTGSLAAYQAAKQGCKTVLVEEHPRAGMPNHCAGLIGCKGLERLLKPIPATIIQNKISKANLISPGGRNFTVVHKKSMLVVDRSKLDQELLERAVKQGVEVLSNTHIKSLIIKNRHICGASGRRRDRNETHSIHTKVTINAEGARARLVEQAGLLGPTRDWVMPAFQYEFSTPVPDPEAIYICFGNSWAPGFFVWIIPFSDQHVRVGLALKRKYGPPKLYLDRFIKKHPICSIFELSSPLRMFGGTVIASGPIPKTYSNGFLVVGDAAGQTKATSGGGVNIGGYCGKLAGKVAAESVQTQNTHQKFLRKYQTLWKRYFGRELTLMTLFRKNFAGKVDDKLLENGFQTAIDSNLQEALSKLPDVDLYAFGFFKNLLTPKFISLGLKKLPRIFKTVLSP
ncbi:MAG: NAD(P)/FAD-dependent oxidoreductase [Promethearchaeota archaeon]